MTEWSEPIHPGDILKDKLEKIGMNASQLAERLEVPKGRIYQIVERKRSITADTSLRLGRFFGTSADFWLNLQKSYELDVVRQKIGEELNLIEPYQEPE